MEKQMETVQMSKQLFDAVLNYLGNRPYIEVANLLAAIGQEAEARARAAQAAQAEAAPAE